MRGSAGCWLQGVQIIAHCHSVLMLQNLPQDLIQNHVKNSVWKSIDHIGITKICRHSALLVQQRRALSSKGLSQESCKISSLTTQIRSLCLLKFGFLTCTCHCGVNCEVDCI